MKTFKLLKLSALNKIILTTLAAITAVFVIQIIMMGRILNSSSRNTAITMYEAHVIHITEMIGGSLRSINNSLELIQQMIAMLDPHSPYAPVVSERIMLGMMDLKKNVYNSWFVFDKGLFHEDKYFIRDYVRHDGNIVRVDDWHIESRLDDPQSSPWFFEPFTTGNKFFESMSRYDYDYGFGETPVYTFTISVPILADGQIIGVCGMEIIFDDMFTLIDVTREREGWTVMLLSPGMTILHGSKHELLYQNLSDFSFKH